MTVHDLYAEGFEPVSGADAIVHRHRDEIASADGLVVVHPNWWGKPPAIMAGWLDRVIVPGVAYDFVICGPVVTAVVPSPKVQWKVLGVASRVTRWSRRVTVRAIGAVLVV